MIKDAEIVAAIREKYPKHTKAAYSVAKRTPETGVMLCPGAKEIRDKVLQQARRPENRKNKFRIYGRLPETLADKVMAKLAGGSMQDLLVKLLTEWVEA